MEESLSYLSGPWKKVTITAELILAILTTWTRSDHVKLSSELPETAQLVAAHYHAGARELELIFSDPSFPIVGLLDIPSIKPTVQRIFCGFEEEHSAV